MRLSPTLLLSRFPRDQHHDVTAEQRQFEHIIQIIDNLRVIGFLTAHVISALPCCMMERSGCL